MPCSLVYLIFCILLYFIKLWGIFWGIKKKGKKFWLVNDRKNQAAYSFVEHFITEKKRSVFDEHRTLSVHDERRAFSVWVTEVFVYSNETLVRLTEIRFLWPEMSVVCGSIAQLVQILQYAIYISGSSIKAHICIRKLMAYTSFLKVADNKSFLSQDSVQFSC